MTCFCLAYFKPLSKKYLFLSKYYLKTKALKPNFAI